MIEKSMVLKVDLKQFLDEEGNELALTEQAKTVFKFLTTIVISVTKNIEKPLVNVDLKCNTRADALSCEGEIDARCITIGMIEWYCDSCEAAGTIYNWQGSMWDQQERTIH
jgi:hypothetical protein